MNDDDNGLVFSIGIVIALLVAVGVFGFIGPFISDWILK
jgi:hypothetical protein